MQFVNELTTSPLRKFSLKGAYISATRVLIVLVLPGFLNAAETPASAPATTPAPAPVTPPAAAKVDSSEVRAQFDKERDTISKWIEVNRIISSERQEWQIGKEILKERAALLERQIGDLEKQVSETEANLAKIHQEIAVLAEQRKTEESASSSLKDNVKKFEESVRVLYNRLPSPLQTKIAPLFQRMPTDPDNTKITLAERFQNVIGILNEVSKLQNESSVVNEVRKVDGGKEVEVQTLYLGLTHGYYTSPTGEYVGYGHLTDNGWQWTAKPELAFELREIQAILTNKMKAKFVALPATIQ
jgi:hypothetical protein